MDQRDRGSLLCKEGEELVEKGELKRAKEIFLEALKIDPENAEIWSDLSYILYLEGRYEDALTLAKVALGLDSQNELYRENLSTLEEILRKGDEGKESENPEVSIIIPVFNKIEYTKRCIEALLKSTENISYELIVLDNGSTDGTKEYLAELSSKNPSIHYIRHTQNLGFVKACNEGARRAKGRFLLFLNNDTEPQKGWLKEMLLLMEKRPDCGIQGVKLVYPDGKLQEAGGIVFSSGDGWNYGRGMDPSDPQFNFVREVDYCSGACLMIRKDLWDKIGGFDERYAPAFYEDTDLCFEARKKGYKVLYNPKSVVIHHEGVTAGRDLSQGVKKYQAINKKKFVDKWKEELKNQFPYATENVFKASSRERTGNIFIADRLLPVFDRASGSLRIFNIIKILKELNFTVTFLSLSDAFAPIYKPILEEMGVEVRIKGSEKDFRIEDFLSKREFDFAIFEFWDVAEKLLPVFRRFSPKTTLIVDTVDIHFLREEREAKIKGETDLKDVYERKEREIGIYRKADIIWTVTEEEKRFIQPYVNDVPVFVIPNIHTISEKEKTFEEREDLIFVGNFLHRPNEDAMIYFCNRIFPLIKERLPHIRLFIVGNAPTDSVLNLQSADIIVTGYVEDIEPFLLNSRVFVSPLRYGAGMKGKIGQSLSFGLPVVTTSIGAEGMDLRDEVDVLIADEEEEFACQVVRLYTDKELWERLSANGKKKVRENWSYEKMRERISILFRKCQVEKRSVEPIGLPSFEANSKSFSSVIIPARDWEYTRLCLESIVRFTDVPYELILVDNGSERSFFESLSEWKKRNPKVEVIYIRVNKNLGFSGGVNKGLAFAKGDFIVILNNDTIVTPKWLSLLLSSFSLSEDIGIVGPMSNYISGPQRIKDCPLDFKDPAKIDFGRLVSYSEKIRKENENKGFYNDFMVGLLMVLKRKVFEEIGGFDERFYPGNFEDDDFCIRARLKKFKIFIRKDVFIFHFGSRTFLRDKVDYQKALEENFDRFKKKWHVEEVKTMEDFRKEALLRGGETFFPIFKEGSCILFEPGKRWEKRISFYLEGRPISSLPLFIVQNGQRIEDFTNFLLERNIERASIRSESLKKLSQSIEGERFLIFSKKEEFFFEEEGLIAVKEL